MNNETEYSSDDLVAMIVYLFELYRQYNVGDGDDGAMKEV